MYLGRTRLLKMLKSQTDSLYLLASTFRRLHVISVSRQQPTHVVHATDYVYIDSTVFT